MLEIQAVEAVTGMWGYGGYGRRVTFKPTAGWGAGQTGAQGQILILKDQKDVKDQKDLKDRDIL